MNVYLSISIVSKYYILKSSQKKYKEYIILGAEYRACINESWNFRLNYILHFCNGREVKKQNQK